MSKFIKLFILLLIGAWLMQAAACAPQVAATEVAVSKPTEEKVVVKPTNTAQLPTPTPTEPPPLLMPGEPPEAERTLGDSDASIRAQEKRVLSGDNFFKTYMKDHSHQRR